MAHADLTPRPEARAAAPGGRRVSPLLVLLGVVLLGAVLTTIATRQRIARNDAFLQEALSERSEKLVDEVVTRWTLFQYGLRGVRGIFVAEGPQAMTRARFLAYHASRDVDQEFPGARGFGFIRRVPRAQEAAFLAQARADGFPDFQIRQIAPHGDERFVIQYIEPVARNLQAVGLDVASEPRRRAAALAAMRSGQVRLSAPITIVQASGNQQQAFLVLLPIYRPGMPTGTEAERELAAYGWAYAPLVSSEVLSRIELGLDTLTLRITDISDPAQPETFFDAGAAEPIGVARSEAAVFGRQWAFEVGATPAFVERLHLPQPSAVAGVGAGVTTGVALATALMMLALRRRQDLARDRAARAALVDSASDAIIALDADGRVETWNAAATTLLGHTVEEALGRALSGLVHTEDAPEATDGQSTLPPGDQVWRRKDGTVVEVAVTRSTLPATAGRHGGQALVVRDISLRRLRERELRAANQQLESEIERRTAALVQAEQRLRTVVDALPAMISSWGPDLRCRLANKAHAAWLARDAALLEGSPAGEALPQSLGLDAARLSAALAGQPAQFEHALPGRGDTPPRQLDVTVIPEQGSDGFVVVVQDVSEAVRARQAVQQALDELRLERERLQTVLAINGVGTWEWDIGSGELRLDERWHALLGYWPGELDPTFAQRSALCHPHDRPSERAALDAHLRGSTSRYEHESRLRHQDGRWRWVLDRGRVTERDADGRPLRMLGTLLDIQALKAAQQRVAESEEFLAHVAQVAGVGGWQFEIASGELSLSPEACQICGIASDPPMALTRFLAAFAPESQQRLEAALRSAVDQGRPFDLELSLRAGGLGAEIVRVVAEAVGLPGQPGAAAVRVVGAVKDITADYREAEALKAARASAEVANAAKSEFLANMSHEIRTPLNALLGVNELLSDTVLEPDQRQLVSRAQMAGRSLLSLVNDVLDLAKIEAGELVLDPRPFRPAQLLDDLLLVHGAAAESKGLDLRVQVDPSVPVWLMGDLERLHQIVGNLLGNAVKFTHEGALTLSLTMARSPGGPALRLSVADTGIGIRPADQARLFQPFAQADSSITRRFGGSGLGLSIVHRLVTLMGGTVQLDSAPGRGSTFVVTVPAAEPDAARLATLEQDAIEVAIAIADDAERQQAVATARQLGWRVGSFASAEPLEADLRQRMAQGLPLPDAVLVDDRLASGSGQGGCNAWDSLEAVLGPGDGARLLRLRAAAQPQSADAGTWPSQARVSGPLDAAALFNAVNGLLAQRTGDTARVIRSTHFDSPSVHWLHGLRVLLVDDNEINLEVARRLLEREGAQVHACTDGAQALAWLEKAPEGADAVLMDVQMPVMDGLEATRRLRADPRLRQLPVIALTAGALVEERRRALQAGMDHFVTKPLVPRVLVATLRSCIERHRGQPAPVTAAGGALRDGAAADWPQVDGIDPALARMRTGGDRALFLAILRRLGRDPDLLDIARGGQDREHMTARLHKLRGSAGSLGATTLAEAAAEAEAAARQADPDWERHLAPVAQQLERLRAAVDAIPIDEPTGAEPGAAMTASDAALVALRDQVRAHDLAALLSFEALAAGLTQKLGSDAVARLREQLQGLQFDAASTALDALAQVQAPPADKN